MGFFLLNFYSFYPSGVIERRVYKINTSILMDNSDFAICPGLSVLFLYASAYSASFFEKLIFELEASSYSFKITCILLRQVISPTKMVMYSAKFTNLISWFPICTHLMLLLASVKLAITSAAIICNTNESGHPWRTPCIRLKGSDWRPFILILDWMLVHAYCSRLSPRARGEASRHPAFMDSSLTVSQMPCPPCGKMGLQSWTVVVAINKLSNFDPNRSWQYGGYVV